jgi:membrane protease subunit HflC
MMPVVEENVNMSARTNLYIFLTVLIVILLNMSIFFVDQRERVLLLQFGKIERADYEPGLHFKLPFFENIKRFDGRVLTLDVRPEQYITGGKEKLLVDSFILWKIDDVATYFTAMGGDKTRAGSRIFNIVNNALRDEFANRSVQDVVAGDRTAMVADILAKTNKVVESFGIQLVNIRIKRIDFPSEINERVFARMKSERERIAKETRAQGAEKAEEIRSDADRQRTVILAEANRESEVLRGNGDAEATDTYAKAYGQNKEFYSLYRRLTAYQKVFTADDMLVIEPKGEFFSNFSDAQN